MVEPDIIGTEDRAPRRRPGWALPIVALVAAGLAAVVIAANAREHAPRRTPPTSPPLSIGQPNDVDVLDQGGACTAIDARGGRLVYLFGVENVGPQPLVVLSVNRSAAGLALVTVGLPTSCDTDRAAPAFSPFMLAPGESRLILLRYRVTNCAAAHSSDHTPATVTARQLHGGAEYRNRIGLPVKASGPCG